MTDFTLNILTTILLVFELICITYYTYTLCCPRCPCCKKGRGKYNGVSWSTRPAPWDGRGEDGRAYICKFCGKHFSIIRYR